MNKRKIITYSAIAIIALISIAETKSVSNYLEENSHGLFDVIKIYKKKLPEGDLSITTSKDEYKIGEEIFFAVQNKTNKTLFIENECPWEPIEIYRFENGGWKHLKAKSKTIKCKGNKDIVLKPYELKGSSFLPWSDIIMNKVGLYKLKVEVNKYRNDVEKEFRIVE